MFFVKFLIFLRFITFFFKEKLNEDLLQVETEISLNQNELSVICDDYNSAVQEEHEVNARYIILILKIYNHF
jgi:hypothetical protein